jgi:hypothetical protein
MMSLLFFPLARNVVVLTQQRREKYRLTDKRVSSSSSPRSQMAAAAHPAPTVPCNRTRRELDALVARLDEDKLGRAFFTLESDVLRGATTPSRASRCLQYGCKIGQHRLEQDAATTDLWFLCYPLCLLAGVRRHRTPPHEFRGGHLLLVRRQWALALLPNLTAAFFLLSHCLFRAPSNTTYK